MQNNNVDPGDRRTSPKRDVDVKYVAQCIKSDLESNTIVGDISSTPEKNREGPEEKQETECVVIKTHPESGEEKSVIVEVLGGPWEAMGYEVAGTHQ